MAAVSRLGMWVDKGLDFDSIQGWVRISVEAKLRIINNAIMQSCNHSVLQYECWACSQESGGISFGRFSS